MARRGRTRPVAHTHVKSYLSKAEEFLSAAQRELDEGMMIAATSLAIHAAICASDVITGVRLELRSAGESHFETIALLRESGPDGKAAATQLARVLPLKGRSEYEPGRITRKSAATALGASGKIVDIARRLNAR